MVSANFSPVNPGAISGMIQGANIANTKLSTPTPRHTRLNSDNANRYASSRPFFFKTSFSVNIGINAAESAPITTRLKIRSGILNAAKNASKVSPAPNTDVNVRSRSKPTILLTNEEAPTIRAAETIEPLPIILFIATCVQTQCQAIHHSSIALYIQALSLIHV